MHVEVCLIVLFIPYLLYDVLAVTYVLCHLVIYPLVSGIHHLLSVQPSDHLCNCPVETASCPLGALWVHGHVLVRIISWGLTGCCHCSISILYVQDVVGCDCDQRQAYPMLPAADLTSPYLLC